jgi:hypothetical protein
LMERVSDILPHQSPHVGYAVISDVRLPDLYGFEYNTTETTGR